MRIEFNFEFGLYNGSMNIVIMQHNNVLFESNDNIQSCITIVLDIISPGMLTICLDGKDNNIDTKVDSDGNIIADKYVRLQGLKVGRIPVLEPNLSAICQYKKSTNEQVNHVYWGWNGWVHMNFDHINPVLWHAHNNPKHVIG